MPRQVSAESETSPLLEGRTFDNSDAASNCTSVISIPHSESEKKEWLGLVLSAISAFLFSVMSVFVKMSASAFPSFQIVFARSLLQLLLTLPFATSYPLIPPSGVRKFVIARGVCGSIGLAMFYYGLSVLPLADATGIIV
jgi:drug/metabolite transporter (DMT)-like permease